MKIAIFLKQVPDTASKIQILSGGAGYESNGIKYIVNPYDELAIEAALQVKEKVAGSEVLVVSLGPARVVEAIRTALAMGADRGIHIDDEGQTYDNFQTSCALAEIARREAVDLIFCGKKAIDDDASQTVSTLAELLQWPACTPVLRFELKADHQGAILGRNMSAGVEEISEVSFPAIIGCEKGLNTPRYASLPGIMKAKSKPLAVVKGLKSGDPLCSLENWHSPAARSAGQIIDGPSVLAKVQVLVKRLHEEAKVI